MNHRFFLKSTISLFVIFAPSWVPHIAVDALGTGATLDPCTETRDCRAGLTCVKRVRADTIECIGFDDPGHPCRCELSDPINCDSKNYNCPPGEGCGIRKDNKAHQYCVSCSILANSSSNFKPIKGVPVCKTSPTPLPSPPRSPGPPRRRLDLCSIVDLCEPPLVCVSHDGEQCDLSSPPCFCLAPNKTKSACTTAADCTHAEETCLVFTRDNSTICGSCTRLLTDPMYVLLENDDDTCDNVQPRPVPNYVSDTNGLAFEICDNDSDCVKPRLCSGWSGSCGKKEFYPCQCQGKGYEPQRCDDFSDCLTGEVCVKIRSLPPATCVSLSYYYSSIGLYQVQGEFPSRGNLTTFDDCTNDYQCMEGLYCTHFTESQLGGCIDRRGCACVPPVAEQCKSSSDCRTGESCVQVPGAQEEPRCYSSAKIANDPFFRKVSHTVGPTPTLLPTNGWLSDLCKQDSDCKQSDIKRACRHFTESTGSCNGRDMCLCKRKDGKDPTCKRSSQCGAGETCAVVVDSKKKVNATCISTKVLDLNYFLALYVEVFGAKRGPLASPSSSPSNAPSLSVSPSASVSPSTSTSSSPSRSPSTSASAAMTPSVSMSVSGTQEPSKIPRTENVTMTEEPNEMCVDVDALMHLPMSELVYTTSRRAAVLCDESGSCATMGHMIEWQGVAMMMKTYCERHAKCQRSVRAVNSPRMHRKLRIASRTVGLLYTPFAARFATLLEERVLQKIVHLGI